MILFDYILLLGFAFALSSGLFLILRGVKLV